MKISIIGAGNVGATAAMKIAAENMVNEIVLLDVKEGVAEGKAMDIMQSLMMTDSITEVIGTTGDYSKTANSDIIIITSGVPRKPGMTREELVGVNSKVMKMVLDGTTKYSSEAIYIVVSNPMDTMTQMVTNYLHEVEDLEYDNMRVMGMGGTLDSARFMYFIKSALSKKYNNRPFVVENVFVVGGHGDTTMIPLVDDVVIDGYNIYNWFTDEEVADIVEKTMKGGATLTKMLGTSAWEAPAQGILQLVSSICWNEERITNVASVYDNVHGICIGTKVRIGDEGIAEKKHYNFPKYLESVEAIKKVNEAL